MIAQMEAEADDRIQCPYCGRKFNENAAQRHIDFCKTKSMKDQMKTGGKPAPASKQRTTGANFGKR
jgi:hypothetical protein